MAQHTALHFQLRQSCNELHPPNILTDGWETDTPSPPNCHTAIRALTGIIAFWVELNKVVAI